MRGGLLFDLAFDVTIVGPCQRCLEPAHADISVAAREYQADVPEVVDEETTPYLRASSSTSTAGRPTRPILALPIVIRCKRRLRGLCPQCGADRNVVAAAASRPSDARWERLRELL